MKEKILTDLLNYTRQLNEYTMSLEVWDNDLYYELQEHLISIKINDEFKTKDFNYTYIERIFDYDFKGQIAYILKAQDKDNKNYFIRIQYSYDSWDWTDFIWFDIVEKIPVVIEEWHELKEQDVTPKEVYDILIELFKRDLKNFYEKQINREYDKEFPNEEYIKECREKMEDLKNYNPDKGEFKESFTELDWYSDDEYSFKEVYNDEAFDWKICSDIYLLEDKINWRQIFLEYNYEYSSWDSSYFLWINLCKEYKIIESWYKTLWKII